MKFIAKENLAKFLDAASAKMTVYVPVDSGKTTDYKAYKPGTTVWRDQSNIDANKGIVDCGHRPYVELVTAMAEINKNVYRLIEHFDAKYAD